MILNKFLTAFRLRDEKEDFDVIAKSIQNGVVFRGTNLWILIFAIFIASLGLNVNSPAVVIGAMLISPLMGPIIGIGFSVGINDLTLLRKAAFNLTIAVSAALITSTVYFTISPLNQAHSEILARTSPNIYDVLIALFGGFACILAIFSRHKGNVIPGAAIATALMPPICTAGYGLATLQLNFFLGAFYLFIINAVFIASAVLFTIKFLKFPHTNQLAPEGAVRTRRIITTIIIVTLVPSLYFGYDIVQQSRFTQNASLFIEKETLLPDDYLLSKQINAKEKSILLVFGGKELSDAEIKILRQKLQYYNLSDAHLEIKQGFAYLENKNELINPQVASLGVSLQVKQAEIDSLRLKMDSLIGNQTEGKDIFNELKIQYPNLTGLTFTSHASVFREKKIEDVPLVTISFNKSLSLKERTKIIRWVKTRIKSDNAHVIIN